MRADIIGEDRDRRPVMKADIIAEDRDGRPVLLVEVKGDPRSDEAVSWFLDILAGAPESIVFGMIVDPDTIRVFRRNESTPVAKLDAIGVLRHYSPDYDGEWTPYGHKRLFEIHIRTLVEAWLRDLAFRWKGGEAPGLDEMERVGLRALIEDGSTDIEVAIGGNSLR
jgi:hypothetical protein